MKANRLLSGLLMISSISAITLTGCSSAVVDAGGGAKGDVKGSVEDTRKHATSVFQSMGIQTTGTQMKDSGHEQDLLGKAGDKDITVTMSDSGNNTTHIEVSAREGTVKWNKDYAKQILAAIIQQS